MLLLVVLLGAVTADPVCPSCDTYTGPINVVCGYDGVTYDSECDLFIALCQSGLITLGEGTDINTMPIAVIVGQYKNNDGKCEDDNPSDHCPICDVVMSGVDLCDTSGNYFNSSCEMAKSLCEDGVISYDDSIDFTSVTEAEYKKKVNVYVNWEGRCTGPCDSGMYSVSGSVPCVKCGPGSVSELGSGSTKCSLCPQDSYQPSAGSSSCLQCPNGTDTLQPGATNVTQCLSDCVSGHYSASGKAPCVPCPTGQWSDVIGATVCQDCGVGNYSTGEACVGCAQGAYNEQLNSVNCTLCHVGTHSSEQGAEVCDVCEPGTFSDTLGLTECIACAPGSYSADNSSTTCKPCSPGSYQIESGKGFCYNCPMGTSQSIEGQTKCPECPLATYQDTEGQTQCIACPARMGTESTGSISVSECQYNECEPGSKAVVVNNRLTCITCEAGWYQPKYNQTTCIKCSFDQYQDSDGATGCISCPHNHITYQEGSDSLDDCEGPSIQLSQETNMNRVTSFNNRRDRLASYLSGNVRSFKVLSGDWYLFSGTRYGGSKIRVSQGMVRNDVNNGREFPHINGLSSRSFYSIRPVVTNVMCYAERGLEYVGYRSKTNRGVPCQNWKANYPHKNLMQGQGTGNHNYCRNPDNDQNGPWCYTTDPNRIFDYCGVPKCIWNVDCYTERGELFRGEVSKSAGNKYNCNDWYSDFPHPHKYDRDHYKKFGVDRHPYCRNPSPGDDNRPWCYTTYFFQRWAYCGVDKCEFSSYDYFKRKHHPKGVLGKLTLNEE